MAMATLEQRHPKAYSIAVEEIEASNMSWIGDKAALIRIVDSITTDVLGRHDIAQLDGFLLQILMDYVGRTMVQLDAELGWDVPGQSDQFEDALLNFLGQRWVFFRATGRLR